MKILGLLNMLDQVRKQKQPTIHQLSKRYHQNKKRLQETDPHSFTRHNIWKIG